MVKEVGNEVGRVKGNIFRYCLLLAEVSDVTDVARRGVVNGNNKVVLCVGKNDLRKMTNT